MQKKNLRKAVYLVCMQEHLQSKGIYATYATADELTPSREIEGK
jgi:hypothetical protein